MMWLCGDTHGLEDIQKVIDFFDSLKEHRTVTRDDYLCILGDVAVAWDDGEHDKRVQEVLESLGCTCLFIDGNHDNHDLLQSYPVTEWHGGKIHMISDCIYHLMRGQIFDIDGKTFFTFGGGKSIDRQWRTPGVSWWPQEMPNAREYEEGLINLQAHDYQVDYILAHTCPEFVAEQLVTYLAPGEELLQRYLGAIVQDVEFKAFYFGHWHFDETVDDVYRCLWNDIIEV